MEEINARSRAFVSDFMTKYRGEAVTLRDELQSRLGTLPSVPVASMSRLMTEAQGQQIFAGDTLAGPAPVGAGAELLEYWAKQLP
jgi:hypothetical protein